MSNSSILGGAPAPLNPKGTDVDALGPSDSSDSGSDIATDLNRSVLPDEGSEGAFPIAHGTSADAAGTGERASADPTERGQDADILPDRIGRVPPGSRDLMGEVDDPDAHAVEDLAVDEDAAEEQERQLDA